MGKINITIDGHSIAVDEGTSVLQAARQAGIRIPTLCDHKDLSPYGACRMCIVEIDGVRGYPTSCTTPATNGMVVRTRTEELETLRNRILELMLSGHPNACLACNHREDCEKYRPRPTKAGRTTRCGFCSNRDECTLREMALEAKSRDLDLPTLYSAHNVEKDDPFMDRDYNLCILCGRCWRICEKIHGLPAISIINRGRWARIGTAFSKSHVYSGCTFCGSCIDICPTGTLTDRYARWYGEPDGETPSACIMCSEGCSLYVLTKGGRTVATRMMSFEPEASLCAIGRFAYSQIVNSPSRIRRPMIRENGEQVFVDWQTAVDFAAKGVGKYQDSIAVIIGEGCSREDRHWYEKFSKTIGGKVGYVSAAHGGEALRPGELKSDIMTGKIKAALVTGDYLDETLIQKLEYLVVIDCLPSPSSLAANAVLPAAVLSEIRGTYRNASGEIRKLEAATQPPGDARPEWMIVSDLAKAMGLGGFACSAVGEITPQVDADQPPAFFEGSPRHNVHDIPTRFRGHFIADTVCALEALGLPVSRRIEEGEEAEGGFLVMEKREIVPNFHWLKIHAPAIARHARPGQFVILMVKETSERMPLTLIDWNAEEGSISLVVEEVGRSSREASTLKAGMKAAHVTGPLGLPFSIKETGTVLLGGGCYGIGAIYSIARMLKEGGNKVICAVEASSKHLLYMEDKLSGVCDELLVATKDGSRGRKGGVQEVFLDLIERGIRPDAFVAIGCTFMMRMVTETTRPHQVPTYVSLNPIMVDGTGMCGACRVSVGGATKFACVDGPLFDGHAVDWDELSSRRSAYALEEIEAMPQKAERNSGCQGHRSDATCHQG